MEAQAKPQDACQGDQSKLGAGAKVRGDQESIKLPLLLLLLAILLQIDWLQFVAAQYIAHVDLRGLRGNMTFDVRPDLERPLEAHETRRNFILEIEALIETDPARWIEGERDEQEFDSQAPIWFDWTLHANGLETHQLAKCSSDDLGAQVKEAPFVELARRPIELDKLNRWSISLANMSAQDIGALIWGKSLRLKLAKVHEQRAGAANPNEPLADKLARVDLKPTTSSAAAPATRAKPAISRPQLNSYSSTPSAAPSKPTFAPRARPNISAKFANKTTLGVGVVARNKRNIELSKNQTESEPLGDEQRQQAAAARAPQPSRETIQMATNKRIVRLYGALVACANLIDVRNVKTLQASFESAQVAGRVSIRGNEDDVTLLAINLYHIRSKVSTRHDWKLMAGDILDSRRDEEKCKYLSLVFDSALNNCGGIVSEQTTTTTTQCRTGELGKRHGPVQVAGQGRSARAQLVDLALPVSALEGSRALFLVLFEAQAARPGQASPRRESILSCAPLVSVPVRKLEANFNMEGVRGTLKMVQRHTSEPVRITYDLFGLEGNVRHLSVHELPVFVQGRRFDVNSMSVAERSRRLCSVGALGALFPSAQLGNLSARHGPLATIDSDYEDHYQGEFADTSLQLFGAQTLAGRSVSLAKQSTGEAWVCATLDYVDEPLVRAEARFHFPVVGRVSFAQPANEAHAPTSVLVELYEPAESTGGGGENADTLSSAQAARTHNWLVHLKPTLADFYNWSQRCESAGEVFDPVLAAAGLSQEAYARQCRAGLLNEPLRCRLGDTSLKSGARLTLGGAPAQRARLFYNDPFLPLTGVHSILGRSMVIYDERAPVQRGDRLACATIKPAHALRASVRAWDSGPSIPSSVRGSLQFEADSVSSGATRVKLDLAGFGGNVEHYAVHQVWLSDDREFPCSNDSLYDIYEPASLAGASQQQHYGPHATGDRVRVGDLSRKHGALEGLQSVQRQFSDDNLPLFAPHSIVGRSVVLRAAVNDFRWVCGNIELDYERGQAREIIAIASFDEPRALVSGYVRFFQLEHKDGSLSDTFLQVDLRLASGASSNGGGGGALNNPAASQGAHDWAVFVNQVGEDAFIATDEVRCIAAGFKWNPFLARDTLESYSTSTCTRAEPDACAMGDLGKRHGMLKLAGPDGGKRALSDANLPLVGNHSIVGRSLVIFDASRANVKLACANIVLDVHLKSNVVIKQTPSFTVARFIEQMRTLLDAAEWLMVPELRATKSVANGECVQMTIHFYGPRAHQMQIELNNLVTLGTVRRSTRTGVDKITTHYRLCRAGQSQLGSSSSAWARLQPPGHLCAVAAAAAALLLLAVLIRARRWTF